MHLPCHKFVNNTKDIARLVAQLLEHRLYRANDGYGYCNVDFNRSEDLYQRKLFKLFDTDGGGSLDITELLGDQAAKLIHLKCLFVCSILGKT